MDIRKENKKIILRYLKENDYYYWFKLKYDKNCDIREVYSAWFNCVEPITFMEMFNTVLNLSYTSRWEIGKRLMQIKNETHSNEMRNIFHQYFKASTPKEKEKLKKFCKEYGILNHSLYLDVYIETHNYFYLDYAHILEASPHTNIEIGLNELIYRYDKYAKKIIGVKTNIFRKIYNFLKIKI